jgi:hypothetical protein
MHNTLQRARRIDQFIGRSHAAYGQHGKAIAATIEYLPGWQPSLIKIEQTETSTEIAH